MVDTIPHSRTAAEWSRRTITNCLVVGSEVGGKAAAIAYTLIETAKLNAVDTHSWLADTLTRMQQPQMNMADTKSAMFI